MTHSMSLEPSAFFKIAGGNKTIELRLNDEKRKIIKIGDMIEFRCSEINSIIWAEVIKLYKFSDFEELYKALSLEKCGYSKNNLKAAHYKDMEKYYSKEQIKKYGALGIELQNITSIVDVKANLSKPEVLTLLVPSVYNPTPERLKHRAEKYALDENVHVYACKRDGIYVGIVVFKTENGTAEILDIAVKPEYRKNGIGSKLIDFILNQFPVNLITAETDDEAVGFYKKCGFVIADTHEKFNVERYSIIKRRNKLLIVDGSNLLFQMFFGMPSRITNSEGKAIQGTLGFVGALLKIIRRTEPTHIAVLFDGEHENDRTELNSDYKANRIDYSQTPKEASPFSQLTDVYSALDYLGIRHTETTVCETDDWIAGYVHTYGENAEVIVVSFDSDFFQLITDNVSVLRYRGDNTTICTPEYLKDKFGIEPKQYADFKSLTGDNSDNIKGADKVGTKTATLLLNEFGNLENVLLNAEAIKKPSIRKSIIKNTDRLRTNYKLIKLEGTAPLPFALEDLQYTYNGITTNKVLKGIGIK